MYEIKKYLFKNFRLLALAFIAIFLLPQSAFAASIIEKLDLSIFVPIVLDSLMLVATGAYDFFVGNGDGVIYVFIWGFLIYSIGLYLIKMYFPKNWLGFAGFSGGGEMWAGTVKPMTIIENTLKPIFRALIAALVLLQVKPIYVTEWLVNPFLQFGSYYTKSITETINADYRVPDEIKCPESVLANGWISKESCDFLVQPISSISQANNKVIERGFDYVFSGLKGLMTLIPHGGENLLNLLTGLILIITFISCNFFMALLIIQGIFNFGIALFLYPFNVLAWVVKPGSDKWFDLWPAFSNIIKALQDLVITMIACAFILTVNIAVINALFNWNNSVFLIASGGSASSNLPTPPATLSGDFGDHAILWLSAILTFYLMLRIFELTKEQLNKYAGSGMDALYKQTSADAKAAWKGGQKTIDSIKKAFGLIKK